MSLGSSTSLRQPMKNDVKEQQKNEHINPIGGKNQPLNLAKKICPSLS